MAISTPTFPFGQLPIDLRLPIWEIFLLQESSGRLIVIDDLTSRILAVPRLLSPLLSVNLESRCCATSFYGMRLRVYYAPDIIVDLIPSISEQRLAFYTRGLRAEMATNVMIQAEEETPPQGILYISPKHDVFVTTIDLIQAFYDDQFNAYTAKRLGFKHWPQGAGRLKYFAMPPDDLRARVERLSVVMSIGKDPDRPCLCKSIKIPESLATLLWDKKRYPALRQCLHFPNYNPVESDNASNLLVNLSIRSRFPLPSRYAVQELVWVEESDGEDGSKPKKRFLRDSLALDKPGTPCAYCSERDL